MSLDAQGREACAQGLGLLLFFGALWQLAAEGKLPAQTSDMLAHLIVAALGEAALLIARAEDRNAALAAGEAALEILLDRLLGP